MASGKIIIAVIAIVIAAFLAVTAWYVTSFITHLRQIEASIPPNVTGNISYNIYLSSKGALLYNNGEQVVPYASFNYTAENVTSANFSIMVYNRTPAINAYVVDTGTSCYKCLSDQGLLYGDLAAALEEYGVVANRSDVKSVDIGSLDSTKNDSLIIIPSGLMPSQLLDSSYELPNLLSKGDTIFYIGQNFTRNINNGIVYLTNQTVLAQLAADSLATEPANAMLTNASGSTFVFSSGYVRGGLPIVNTLNGSIVAFSNYPDALWSNSSVAANAIAYAIMERQWIGKVSQGSYYVQNKTGIATVFASAIGTAVENGTYPLALIELENNARRRYIEMPLNISYARGGAISIPSIIGESATEPLIISISSGGGPQLSFHVDIYNRNLEYVGTIPIGFFNTTSSIESQYTFDMPSGDYIASLKDINGKVYSSALFRIANISITPISLDFQHGIFNFSVESAGFPVSNIRYNASIGGLYGQSGNIENGLISYAVPRGTVISYGTKNFEFNIIGANYTLPEAYVHERTIPTFYIEFGVAIFIVVLLNLVLRAPTRDDYYIDVPDFLPAKKIEMTTDAGSIKGLFDTINLQFRWRYMPLTPEEIKAGISNNLRFNNMPISITLQNTVSILDKLTAKGILSSAYGYYLPNEWISAAGHNDDYLVIFRKLRDYCIEHAMLFTDIGSSEKADMAITKNGVQSLVYIYSGEGSMKDISFGKETRVFIVFITDEALREFTDKLYSAYGSDAEMLKLGISSGTIRLISTERMDRLLY